MTDLNCLFFPGHQGPRDDQHRGSGGGECRFLSLFFLPVAGGYIFQSQLGRLGVGLLWPRSLSAEGTEFHRQRRGISLIWAKGSPHVMAPRGCPSCHGRDRSARDHLALVPLSRFAFDLFIFFHIFSYLFTSFTCFQVLGVSANRRSPCCLGGNSERWPWRIARSRSASEQRQMASRPKCYEPNRTSRPLSFRRL